MNQWCHSIKSEQLGIFVANELIKKLSVKGSFLESPDN